MAYQLITISKFIFLTVTLLCLTACGGDPSTAPPSSVNIPIAEQDSNSTSTTEEDTNASTPTLEASDTPQEPIQQNPKPKNVILLMFDDLDYHDFGYTSLNGDVITPNIDALARDGRIFSRYYTASGICSPTRVSLLTGQSPLHYGLSRLWPDLDFSQMGTNVDSRYRQLRGLPSSERTYVDVAKDAGYSTFHIGKWHVGTNSPEHLPSGQGFDDFQIMQINPDRGVLNYFGPDGAQTTDPQEWRPAYQIDQIIEFMEDNNHENTFINFWPTEPHTPLIVPPGFDNSEFQYNLTTRRGALQSIMNTFDLELARLIDYLKQNDIYDDTLFIVTSDNGGLLTNNNPSTSALRSITGGKGSLREGGIRVPMSVTWPDVLPPSNDDNSVVVSYDIMPTLASILSQTAPSVRGEDISQGLFNESQVNRSPALFEMRTASWRLSDNDALEVQRALIDGCYKLADFGSPRLVYKLYDLCIDPTESTDLASTQVEIYDAMIQEIERQRLDLGLVLDVPSLSGAMQVPDHRLNINNEDLTVTGRYVSGDGNVYSRGEGVSLSISDGSLNLSITGPITLNNDDALDTVLLSTPISQGEIFGLSVTGYISSGSTIELIINGQRVAIAGALPSTSPESLGNSVYSIRNQPDAVASVGSSGLVVESLTIHVTQQ